MKQFTLDEIMIGEIRRNFDLDSDNYQDRGVSNRDLFDRDYIECDRLAKAHEAEWINEGY